MGKTMKLTSFCCCCLAVLITALSNSKIQCARTNSSSSRYIRPNEPKISTVTSKEELTTNSQTTISISAQNKLLRSSINASNSKVVEAERKTNTQPGGRTASSDRKWRPSPPDQASSITTNLKSSRNLTRPAPPAVNLPSIKAGRTDRPVTSLLTTSLRAESTTTITPIAGKWLSTPQPLRSSTFGSSNSTKSSSKSVAKTTTTMGANSSTTADSFSTIVGVDYSSTTDNSSPSTRAGRTTENDGVVFPSPTVAGAASKIKASSRTTTSKNQNWSSSTLPTAINATGETANTTEKIDFKEIINGPKLICTDPEQRKDDAGKCREVV